jgi:hypothetical protein
MGHWRPQGAGTVWLCSGQAKGSRADSTWSGPGEARWPHGGALMPRRLASAAEERRRVGSRGRLHYALPPRGRGRRTRSCRIGAVVGGLVAEGGGVPVAVAVAGGLAVGAELALAPCGGAEVDPAPGGEGDQGRGGRKQSRYNLMPAFLVQPVLLKPMGAAVP